MRLCYKCYSKRAEVDEWDRLYCDCETREECESCGLVGLYVRDVQLNKKEIDK